MAGNKVREIKTGKVAMTPFSTNEVGTDPVKWLEQQAQSGMLLLAHADDGVIWGRATVDADNGNIDLKLSSPKQTPFRHQTLIMARLFDTEQEIFLWQVEEGIWRARQIRDSMGEACSYYDETQILWGNKVEQCIEGFVYLAEGSEGMYHTPPEDLFTDEQHEHKASLNVRHYLHDDDGWLRVVFSRLVKPEPEEVTE
ncbi:MAG: TIGR03984 family CRISPR-associated protein [Caldilinea sp. CFX5]|nr:TIGR03984 family CRISPR-associated protein [Caldilinea sp. CFX5]